MGRNSKGLSIVRDWMDRAKDGGSSLTQVCDKLNISRSIPEQWKKKLPDVVDVYVDMKDKLDRDTFMVVSVFFESIPSSNTYIRIENEILDLEITEVEFED